MKVVFSPRHAQVVERSLIAALAGRVPSLTQDDLDAAEHALARVGRQMEKHRIPRAT